MGQSEKAWNEVGEQIKSLGSMLKVHYHTYEGDDITEVVSDDEVKDALHTLGESVKAAFASIGDAFADAEIRDEARETAGSFFDALGATFSDLGHDISEGGTSEDLPSGAPPGETTSPDASGVEE